MHIIYLSDVFDILEFLFFCAKLQSLKFEQGCLMFPFNVTQTALTLPALPIA